MHTESGKGKKSTWIGWFKLFIFEYMMATHRGFSCASKNKPQLPITTTGIQQQVVCNRENASSRLHGELGSNGIMRAFSSRFHVTCTLAGTRREEKKHSPENLPHSNSTVTASPISNPQSLECGYYLPYVYIYMKPRKPMAIQIWISLAFLIIFTW